MSFDRLMERNRLLEARILELEASLKMVDVPDDWSMSQYWKQEYLRVQEKSETCRALANILLKYVDRMNDPIETVEYMEALLRDYCSEVTPHLMEAIDKERLSGA